MTMLFRRVGRSARTRPVSDDLVVGISDQTKQIVYFSDEPGEGLLKVPNQVLKDHAGGLSLHSDLLDCHIDICSPEVLLRFSDNFDYLELRKGFVASEVANLDLGQYIFAEILDSSPTEIPRLGASPSSSSSSSSSSSAPSSKHSSGGVYAARAHDPRSYDAISRDLLHRWVYPIVPEANLGNSLIWAANKGGGGKGGDKGGSSSLSSSSSSTTTTTSSSSTGSGSSYGGSRCRRSHVNAASNGSSGHRSSTMLHAFAAKHKAVQRRFSSKMQEGSGATSASGAGDKAMMSYHNVLRGSHRALLYKEEGVVVPRSATISGGVLLGKGTVLGEGCAVVGGCLLGAHCTVGDGALLHAATLWVSKRRQQKKKKKRKKDLR